MSLVYISLVYCMSQKWMVAVLQSHIEWSLKAVEMGNPPNGHNFLQCNFLSFLYEKRSGQNKYVYGFSMAVRYWQRQRMPY